MKRCLIIALLALIIGSVGFAADAKKSEVPRAINEAREEIAVGNFSKAMESLKKEAEKTDDPELKRELLWERERIRRITLDYSDTQNEVLTDCARRIRDFSPEEFKKWEAEGKFDVRIIDGEKRFMGACVSNLAKRYPEIRKRFRNYAEEDEGGKKILAMVKRIKEAAKKSDSPYVLPLRLHVRQSVAPKKEFTKAEDLVRAWMPFPRITDYQKNVKVIDSKPGEPRLDEPDSVIRSAYFEAKTTEDNIPEFVIEYEYDRWAIRHDVDPEDVEDYKKPELWKKYTAQEEPNIVFNEQLIALVKNIADGEENHYLRAKKIYDWVCENTVYSYAREYSTLLDIPMYVYENRYGDCGQEALFFITLCRIGGIPAAWRSGWECIEGDRYGMHDWAAIYVEPWGWMPVDPYMGVWAIQESTLPEADRVMIKDFYFGNLDPWRLQANAKNNAELDPEKIDFRSETVDFQRGEMESGGKNLYFNEFRRSMKLEVVKELAGESEK